MTGLTAEMEDQERDSLPQSGNEQEKEEGPAPLPEAGETESKAAAAETAGEAPSAQGEACLPAGEEDPLAGLRAELEAERLARRSAEERALRYRADFENLRRRTQLEAEQLRTNLLAEIVSALLPVLDDLERAAASAPAEAPPGWAAGLDLIHRRFLAVLGALGVARIESLGRPFDPERHEAIARVEDSGRPSNTIVEELRAGYAVGDRLIRPALVKVQA